MATRGRFIFSIETEGNLCTKLLENIQALTRSTDYCPLVLLLISNARNSVAMFFEPSTHFVIGPGPFNRLGITVVVFGPRRHDTFDEFVTTVPGLTLQVMMFEAMDQDLSLIEPRCMNRGKAWTPPGAGRGKVVPRIAGGMAGITILDQKDALQPAVALLEPLQRLEVVHGVFSVHDHRLHPPGVNGQEDQDVNGPVARVLELLLFNRTGDRSANRTPFQDLAIGDLINADIPKPLRGQALGVAVAPQHFLGPLLELRIPPCRFPIACAVRLQVDVVQNTANRRGTDGRHNAIGDGLPRQVLARPMGDMQPFSHRLKAGQLNNLRPLQGGKSAAGSPPVEPARPQRPYRLVHSRGRPARSCWDHIAAVTPRFEPVRRRQSPTRFVHVGLDTTGGFGCEPVAATAAYRSAKAAVNEVYDHA